MVFPETSATNNFPPPNPSNSNDDRDRVSSDGNTTGDSDFEDQIAVVRLLQKRRAKRRKSKAVKRLKFSSNDQFCANIAAAVASEMQPVLKLILQQQEDLKNLKESVVKLASNTRGDDDDRPPNVSGSCDQPRVSVPNDRLADASIDGDSSNERPKFTTSDDVTPMKRTECRREADLSPNFGSKSSSIVKVELQTVTFQHNPPSVDICNVREVEKFGGGGRETKPLPIDEQRREIPEPISEKKLPQATQKMRIDIPSVTSFEKTMALLVEAIKAKNNNCGAHDSHLQTDCGDQALTSFQIGSADISQQQARQIFATKLYNMFAGENWTVDDGWHALTPKRYSRAWKGAMMEFIYEKTGFLYANFQYSDTMVRLVPTTALLKCKSPNDRTRLVNKTYCRIYQQLKKTQHVALLRMLYPKISRTASTKFLTENLRNLAVIVGIENFTVFDKSVPEYLGIALEQEESNLQPNFRTTFRFE